MTFNACAMLALWLLQGPPTIPAPTNPESPAVVGQVAASYVIGAQDQLRVTVYDESEMSGNYRVDDLGMITFPLLGRVAAGGLTLAEFQDKLRLQLAAGYIRNPQLRVEIDQYKSQNVIVLGEVRSPGKITLTGTSMTLLEALAAAGSQTPAASDRVSVLHPKRSGKNGSAAQEGETITVSLKNLQAAQNVLLRDGDIITVPKAETFYIVGQVKNSGLYVLDAGMTVQQAIAKAGGLSDRGSDRRIVATRIVNGKSRDIDVRLEDRVQPDDTITIRQRIF